ncbi:MAG: tyrosine-type recombinase/integrase [Bradyrhizobium sp.]|nr:tyrosine-type recombinase/integrase [Bradyrhizobium sp.]
MKSPKRRHILPRYVSEDVAKATGQVRLYFRRPGQAKIRIWPSVEQEGFWPAYEAAKQGKQLPKPDEGKAARLVVPASRTFAGLCRAYYESAAFKQLTPVSQRTRKGILEHCCAEPLNDSGDGIIIGGVPVDSFGHRHVKWLIDLKAGLPEAANNRVKAIRGVFAWHLEGVEGARNPCSGIKKLKPKNSEGFHTWSLSEVEQYERQHPIGTNARLALDLAFYTLQRKSDVVSYGPADITIEVTEDGEVAWLLLRHQKKTNARVEMPIIPPLAESIAARPYKDGPTFLMTSFGKPYTANGMGNAFRGWCDEAGLPHCTMHGLRKAQSSRLAELGVDEHGIGSVTGHVPGSKSMAIYTKNARQKIMAKAAMQKLLASLPTKTPAAKAVAGSDEQLSHLKNEDA